MIRQSLRLSAAALLGWTLLAGVAAAQPASTPSLLILSQAVNPTGPLRTDLLAALRQLRDPALQPLMAALASGDSPGLRAQGVLGLAELADPPRLNPLMVSGITDPIELASILGQALGLDLLPPESIRDVLKREKLDPYVEAVLRGRLARSGDKPDVEALTKLLAADHRAAPLIAAFELAEAGVPKPLEEQSEKLLQMNDPARGVFVGELLEHVRTEQTTSAGPLLGRLASLYRDQPALHADILRTWLRVAPEAAAPIWARAFAEATQQSDQLRLALAALDAAEGLAPESFDTVIKAGGSADPILAALGSLGKALAAKEGQADAVRHMLSQRYQQAELWIGDRARSWPPERAKDAWLALIQTAATRPDSTSRVSEAVPAAAEGLARVSPDLLREPIASAAARSDARLTEALIVGLMRAGAACAWDAAKPPQWPHPNSAALALVCEARSDPAFGKDKDRLSRLTAVADGLTGRLPAAVRVQAAWLALKHAGEADATLARLLARQ
ncbi:MAG: hypothetical protein SFZ24_11735 [Planctomycetota bacterium]|nr:hypothetical protein [Planctomycetota bacterium]